MLIVIRNSGVGTRPHHRRVAQPTGLEGCGGGIKPLLGTFLSTMS